MERFSSISDDALLQQLHVLVSSHRSVTVELILHLGEVDARRLHVAHGFSSLFSYCVERFRFSEDEACRRIEAARLARRFPDIQRMLLSGTLTLTVVGLLKAHLTDDNFGELLALVSGVSVRHAKERLATRFPQRDVPASIRKLPSRGVTPSGARGAEGEAQGMVADSEDHAVVKPQGTEASTTINPLPAAARVESGAQSAVGAPAAAARVDSSVRPAVGALPAAARERVGVGAGVTPLSADRFLVKFTASRALREKLEVASDLMRHVCPADHLAIVVERGVDLLIADLEKKRQGRGSQSPRKMRPAQQDRITRAARREVVERDGWRCSFVSEDGRRCDSRGFLEFDHETPRGRGGGGGPENLRILCRAHNRWVAERVYGKEHIERAVAVARRNRLER